MRFIDQSLRRRCYLQGEDLDPEDNFSVPENLDQNNQFSNPIGANEAVPDKPTGSFSNQEIFTDFNKRTQNQYQKFNARNRPASLQNQALAREKVAATTINQPRQAVRRISQIAETAKKLYGAPRRFGAIALKFFATTNPGFIIAAIGGGIAIFIIILGFIFFTTTNIPGANINGGTAPRSITNPHSVAVAAHNPGLVVSNSVENIDEAIKTISTLLSNPPAGANVPEARKVLGEMMALQNKIRTNAYTRDPKKEADIVRQYDSLLQKLYEAIYPGRKAARDRVQKLVGTRIFPSDGAGCAPKNDLRGLALSENLLSVMESAAGYSPFTITCLMTGHRKYINKSPKDGHPRCGDPKAEAGKNSLHCLGLAMDIVPNSSLENYLKENQRALKITTILNEGNHLHIEVSL